MSAFAVVFERSNTPLESGVLERIMPRLSHRGPDGWEVQQLGFAALGHWHFWTTPEDVGERQPLELDGLPFMLVMDGRLDNRSDLLNSFRLDGKDDKIISDAALILHAYAHWEMDCLTHLIGEYAFVIIDKNHRELFCARDSLGDRTLFFSSKGTRLVVASEPWAVAGAEKPEPEINDLALAHYFVMQTPADGQTLFKDIHELLPAHAMHVSAAGQRTWRAWTPDLSRKIQRRSDEEYGEEFRHLLEQSIRCRLRATTPVGVLMSGGLDSTSVASLAARTLPPQSLTTTISYVFNELTSCDERQYIEAVKEKWNLRSIQIPCDDAWPFKEWRAWPFNPNLPEGNPYRLLKERAYHQAQAEGLRVMLTGGFGDHLYGAGKDWLADWVMEGRFLKAGRELYRQIRSAGLRWTLRAGFLQRAARRLVDLFPGGEHLHRRSTPLGWLTDYASSFISKGNPGTENHPGRQDHLVGIRSAVSSTAEIFHASRHTLELRHPYRDRRLVEFVLSLPAYQLYYHRNKYILRTAMQGILPETIRTRIHPTFLGELYFRGCEREKELLRSWLLEQDPSSHRFIRPEWLMNFWDITDKSKQDIMGVMVPWLCMSYKLWYHNHTSK